VMPCDECFGKFLCLMFYCLACNHHSSFPCYMGRLHHLILLPGKAHAQVRCFQVESACINCALVAFLFRQLVLKSLNFLAVLQLFALGTLI
jgi:hypothetical protein